MLVKNIMAGAAASALLATVAFAQSPTTTTDRSNMAPAASSTTNSSYQGDWRTSKLVGVNVYNNENESIGSINDLLTDKSGNIKAVVIGVGGFLGVGEHLVAVAFDQIKFVDTPVPSTTSSTAPASGTRPAPTTTGAASTNTPPASATPSKSNPWYPDHAVLNATKDQLKQMPEFKYST
ncbi:MAG: PRC-barrel domain-containing protein [Xanthobacteraceae bacterium]